MGWRFRRSVKLLPGVRLNFSNRGMSTSIGPTGATLNFSNRGTRATVGLPGTGVSYSALTSSRTTAPSYLSNPTNSRAGTMAAPTPASGGISGRGWAVVSVLALLAVGKCVGSIDPSPSSGRSPTSVKYVSASSLNCRAAPSQSTAAVRALRKDERVAIGEETNGWSQVAGAEPCWVSSQYLTAIAPAAQSLLSPSSSASPPSAARLDEASDQVSPSAATAFRSEAASKRGSKPRSSTAARRTSRSTRGFGGPCPCSGNNICIGPRGGRYCITSGGNKRYGV